MSMENREMSLGQGSSENSETTVTFESALEVFNEVDDRISRFTRTADAGRNLLALTTGITNSTNECSKPLAYSLGQQHETLLISMGVDAIEPVMVQHEKVTTNLGTVEVVHEGVKQILADGWRLLKIAINDGIAAAGKLYDSLMMKIKGYESKFEDLIKDVKDLKETDLSACELKGKKWNEVKLHYGSILSYLGMSRLDGDLDKVEGFIKGHQEGLTTFVKGYVQIISDIIEGKTITPLSGIAKITNTQIGKMVGRSKMLDVANENAGVSAADYMGVIRAEGKSLTVLRIFKDIRTNRIRSVLTRASLSDGAIQELTKNTTNEDKCPSPTELTSLLQTVKKLEKMDAKKVFEALKKVTDNFDKELKDTDDASATDMAKYSNGKSAIQAFAPVVSRTVRENAMNRYKTTDYTYKFAKVVYDELKKNSKDVKSDNNSSKARIPSGVAHLFN